MIRTASLSALLCILLTACGGSEPPVQDTPPQPSEPAIVGPEIPWEEMDHAARRRHMATRVLPVMAELFQGFDAERFANFSCDSCHGDNAAAVGFEMPNRLPVLWPSGTPEQQRMVELQPDMARFMFSRVLPTMTKLLGKPAWDNATKTGFSCFHCHPQAETTP